MFSSANHLQDKVVSNTFCYRVWSIVKVHPSIKVVLSRTTFWKSSVGNNWLANGVNCTQSHFEISRADQFHLLQRLKSVRNPSFNCKAAFSVNVDKKISSGFTPWKTNKFKVRQSNTLVYPDPGPAVRNNGPSVYRIASRWLSFGWKFLSFHRCSIVNGLEQRGDFLC